MILIRLRVTSNLNEITLLPKLHTYMYVVYFAMFDISKTLYSNQFQPLNLFSERSLKYIHEVGQKRRDFETNLSVKKIKFSNHINYQNISTK